MSTKFQRDKIEAEAKKVAQKAESGTDSLITKLVLSKYTAVIIWGAAVITFVFALWLIFG